MTLTLNIQRQVGIDTQVSCVLDGASLNEFYSFGETITNEEIRQSVETDLTQKGIYQGGG